MPKFTVSGVGRDTGRNRALVEDRDGASVAGPDHPTIQQAAAELGKDESVLTSIRRYVGTDLIWFGEWTAPNGNVYSGGSNQTIAYKRAAALLRELLPSELRQSASRASVVVPERDSDTQVRPQRRAGCASVVGAVALGALVLLGVVAWVNRLVANKALQPTSCAKAGAKSTSRARAARG